MWIEKGRSLRTRFGFGVADRLKRAGAISGQGVQGGDESHHDNRAIAQTKNTGHLTCVVYAVYIQQHSGMFKIILNTQHLNIVTLMLMLC